MASIWSRLVAGTTAFRKAFFASDAQTVTRFDEYDARQVRYQLLWSLYENTVYDDVHTWATKLKTDYGLYKATRPIYNPAYRLGSFWKTHLLGGTLDPQAGDGKEKPSALPIIADDKLNESQAQNLRAAIAQVWNWSNWQSNKNIYAQHGAVLGDVALKVIDDTRRGKVFIKVLHPGLLADVSYDEVGNVRSYEIREQRTHPQNDAQGVIYKEIATREGDDVVYQTFLNDAPFAWPDNVDAQGNALAEWRMSYGFIPLVVVQHNSMGLLWGWAEAYPGLSKFREVDDQASKLSDQIRIAVHSKWAVLGMPRPQSTTVVTGQVATDAKPSPDRAEEPYLYLPQATGIIPLVAPLDIAAATAHIASLLTAIESDYPELNRGLYDAGGNQSGIAIRTLRQPVEVKAAAYRTGYDYGLVRAQQMAISIGALGKYKGFEAFTPDSFEKGLLNHSIGERPVFANDPMDALERKQIFWAAVQAGTSSGAPLETVLRDLGWTDEQVSEMGTQKLAAIQLQQEDVIPTETL